MRVDQSVEMSFLEYSDRRTTVMLILRTFEMIMREVDSTGLMDSRSVTEAYEATRDKSSE